MSEDTLRIGYRPDRILMKSERILDPQFNQQGVYLSGAQVEMLRNVSGYLNRRSSYVDTYEGTYYIMPDNGDWDEIQAIVADLEDKLADNDNVVWGYSERWAEDLDETMVGSGGISLYSEIVPVGELWVLQAASCRNTDGATIGPAIGVYDGSHYTWIAYEGNLAAMRPLVFDGEIVLAAGDRVRLYLGGIDEGDELEAGVRGYKMVVPD